MPKGTQSVDERFWSKVDKDGPLPTWAPFLGPCWLWTASTRRGGYGQFRVGSKMDGTRRYVYAHRFAYEAVVGPIPEGLELDHWCRVPACVQPDHLDPVTHAENVARGQGGRTNGNMTKTHCVHGHPFDEANTRIRPGGGRACRACDRERHRPSSVPHP